MAGKFWIGRRKFYRRNMAGVEEFEGYGKAVASNFFEGLINIVSGIMLLLGICSIGVGLIFLFAQ